MSQKVPRCEVCVVLEHPDLLHECRPCLETSDIVRYDLYHVLPGCCPYLRVYEIVCRHGPISYDKLLEKFAVRNSRKEVRALDIILKVLLDMELIHEPEERVYDDY